MSDSTKLDPPVDLQDPLPEASWFWRRIFVFLVTAAVLYMVWGAMDRLGSAAALQPERGITALLTLCKWLLSMVALMATYYMVAPSAEQITKMVKTAALLRSGVQVAGRQRVTPSGATDTSKTVGIPPVAPIPGPSEGIEPLEAVEPPPASDGAQWPPR